MSTFKFVAPSYPVVYTSSSVKPMFSARVGGVIDIPITRHTYFTAGIGAACKGAEKSFSYHYNDSFNERVHQKLTVYYADASLCVLYKTGIQGKGRFVAGIGAAPAYIIGGSDKYEDVGVANDSAFNFSGKNKINIGKTLKGFDIGLILTAGYELPTGLYLRANYTGGVSDIGVQSEVIKNRVFSLSIGYLLGKGRNINKEADDLIDHTP